MIQINWDKSELRPRGYRSRPHKKEAYYLCTCECGNTYWLRACDAQRAEKRGSSCSRCQHREAGRRGYEVTSQRYGRDYALERVAVYQRAHPSKPEQASKAWLEAHGIPHVHQYIFQEAGFNFVIDFVIHTATGVPVAAEVNGWKHQQYRQDRDEKLRALWPNDVVFLDAAQIVADPAYLELALRPVLDTKS